MSRRKQKQGFNTILLVIIAVSIGGYILWEKKKDQANEKEKVRSTQLFQLDKKLNPSNADDRKKMISEITKVTFVNSNAKKGQHEIVAVQKKGGWLITKPLVAPADKKKLESALEDVLQAKYKRKVKSWGSKEKADPKLLKRYALDKPALQISFTYKGKEYGYSVGKKLSFTGDYFTLLSGQQRIVMAGSSLQRAAEQKLFALRNKRVFTQKTSSIKTLTIISPLSKLVLERKNSAKASGWFLKHPLQTRADKMQVNSLLSSLRYLEANVFLSEDFKKDAKKFGLNRPTFTVEAAMRNGQKYMLYFRLAKEKKKLVVYTGSPKGGPIAKVNKYIIGASNLGQTAFGLRDKTLIKFNPRRMNVLRIKSKGKEFQALRLQNKAESWQVRDPSPNNGEKDKIENLISDLRSLKVKKFVVEKVTKGTLAKYGLDNPSRSYLFYKGSSSQLITSLLIGNKQGSHFFATTLAKDKVVLLDAAKVNKLATASWQLIKGGKPPKQKAAQKAKATSKPAAQKEKPSSKPAKAAQKAKPKAAQKAKPKAAQKAKPKAVQKEAPEATKQ